MDEFTLIKTLFQPLQTVGQTQQDPEHGFLKKIGDDAAVWKGQGNLAFSIDTLVEGVHFTPDIPPEDLGYRCLAVNLSDLAAMAATPAFYTLAITLPSVDLPWISSFVQGIRTLAEQHDVPLVGGDTTRGPLTITLQAHGLCPQPVYREGACPGDDVYVSGTLGDAAAGLKLWLNREERHKDHNPAQSDSYLIERFHRPTPRIALGQALAGVATAMLDVSDGLLADLSHIAEASQVQLTVDARRLPLSSALVERFGESQASEWALTGGDDYELAFTAPRSAREILRQIAEKLGIQLTRIGQVAERDEMSSGERGSVQVEHALIELGQVGYNHFPDNS